MIFLQIYRIRYVLFFAQPAAPMTSPQPPNEPVSKQNIIKQERGALMEKQTRSPLHEKRILLLLVKKQMIGRRAYSDITKVKPSNREVVLYGKKQRPTTAIEAY